MSGTGKSAVIAALAGRGFKAVDTDSDEWSEWDWIWREDRVQRRLATEDADLLFVSGCKSNQRTFYPQFDHIVLLSAPATLIIQRLITRTTNPYGKHPDERAQVLRYLETVEPLLRRRASIEVDTSVPVEQVIETVLRLVCP